MMVLKRLVLVIAITAVWPQAAESLSCYSCSGDACVNGNDPGVQIPCTESSQECYTKFNGYVPTERGCVSATNPCTGSFCESCSGNDYCNVLGAPQHKCVICSSILDETCISNPGELQAQRCEAASMDVAETQCFSRVIGVITDRGCIQSQKDLDACDSAQCSTCAAESCNNGEYPEGRQKCVKCSAANCNSNTVTSYCELPDDSCVTAKKTDGTYLKNCEQSMTEADQQFCQSNPRACSFCGQNECNKREFNETLAGRQCYTCQGSGCLQSSLTIETCHQTDDKCYTIFDGFNPTKRGCRSALTTEDKATCDDPDDVECNLCDDDNLCNVGGRQDHKCVYCSSTLNGNCISSSSTLAPIQCPAPTTEVSDEALCYTRIIGTVTERGCLGSATDAEQCDPEANCAMCAGNGCNSELFPSDRRKCVVGSVPNQYCPDPWDDCVQIASNTSGGANIKKCESSMTAAEVSFCEASGNKCDFCEEDNCNQQDVVFDYLQCMYCNSNDDPSCATNPSSITNLAHCSTCITILTTNAQGKQILQRDCLEQLAPEDAEKCTTSNSNTSDATCTACTTNQCNNGPYPANRLECYSCPQPPCVSHNTITLEYCQTYSATDVCIMLLDASGVPIRLGCNSTLSAAEQSICKTNPQRCRYGSKSKSNDPTLVLGTGKCVQCSSSNEPSCMNNPSTMEGTPCNDPANNQCFSRLVSGSITERGCLNDLDTTSQSLCRQHNSCALCTSRTENCNSGQYPPDLMKCFQCDSTTNSTCKAAQSGTAEPCSPYNSGNRCYIVVQKNGDTVRKCSTKPRATECAGADRCEICHFSGCNRRVSTAVMPANLSDGTTTTTAKPVTTQKPGGAAAVGVNLTVAIIMMIAPAVARRLSGTG